MIQRRTLGALLLQSMEELFEEEHSAVSQDDTVKVNMKQSFCLAAHGIIPGSVRGIVNLEMVTIVTLLKRMSNCSTGELLGLPEGSFGGVLWSASRQTLLSVTSYRQVSQRHDHLETKQCFARTVSRCSTEEWTRGGVGQYNILRSVLRQEGLSRSAISWFRIFE